MQEKKYRYQVIKQKEQSKLTKEAQMTGQHEPLWKPEVKSGAPEFPVPHAAPVMMSPVSYQGMKRTHDNNIMAYICHISHDGHWDTIMECPMMVTTKILLSQSSFYETLTEKLLC